MLKRYNPGLLFLIVFSLDVGYQPTYEFSGGPVLRRGWGVREQNLDDIRQNLSKFAT